MLASRTAMRGSLKASRSLSAARPAVVGPRRARRSLAVKALKVGDSLKDSPEFYRVLKASDGSIVSLAMFVNEHKQPLVIFFYPAAGTPGCTKEACKFRDEYSKFTEAGAVVFGISSDAPEKNAEFAKAQRLPFLLLTDPSSIMRKTFGIPNDFLLLPGRQTFVFDPNGKCVLAFNSQLEPEKHVDEALAALRQIGALKA